MRKTEILLEETLAKRCPPLNLSPSDRELFEHEFEVSIPACQMHRLSGVTIRPNGLLYQGGELLKESVFPYDVSDHRAGLRSRLKNWVKCFAVRQSLTDEAYWVTDTKSGAYFHWVLDALPRLFVVREGLKSSVLLLPSRYRPMQFVTDSLVPFEIAEIRYVDEPLRCSNLCLPMHTAPSGNYHEGVIAGLRDLFRSHYGAGRDLGQGERIYISRGKAERRKILNEEECVAVLEEFGFKVCYFEDLTFEEQVQTMMEAEHVVSNHGAGLTNMLFMAAGGSVLELRKNGDSHNNCYYSLPHALGLGYRYLLCEGDGPNAFDSNLMVDCDLLKVCLQTLEAS